MYSKKDFDQIDYNYFYVKTLNAYNICLQSKNSKHYWNIQCQEIKNRRSLIVLHRHKNSGDFHIQPHYHPRTIEQAQDLIKEHDEFHLNVRLKNKNGRSKKQRVN